MTAPTPSYSPAARHDFAAFGLDLFRQVADGAPDANAIVSPASAGLALSLLGNGATGETRAQIERALAAGMEMDALNAANVALDAALRTEDVQMEIGSSIWARGGTPVLPGYVEQSRRLYRAAAAALDFDQPEAAERINAWVSRSTSGRIKTMVSHPIEPNTILFLLNAVYFKGRWQEEFRPKSTRPGAFHAPGGDVQVPMMSRTGTYDHLRGTGFQALRMPYVGDRFALYVLLPDRGQPLGGLREQLSAKAWRGWMDGFTDGRVNVVMPRFRLELFTLLNAPLKAMGIARAFVPGAELDAMLPAGYVATAEPYVTKVLQKVFFEVNEEGTEASAATMVEIATRGIGTVRVRDFIVDRPFLLAIRDDQTGTLLFIGQVNDPT